MKGLSLAKKGEVRDSKHPHLRELDRLQGVSYGYRVWVTLSFPFETVDEDEDVWDSSTRFKIKSEG